MNSEALNKWLTLAANVGVVAGLIFVAMEVQQTRNAVLGATYMARATAEEEWQKWVAESEHMVDAVNQWSEASFSELSPEVQSRLLAAVEAAFHRMDGIYYQYELGLLPDDYYETTYRRLMEIWVPRWRDSGFLDRGWIVPRPSFQAEIRLYLDAPTEIH